MTNFEQERLQRRVALATDEKKFLDDLKARTAAEAAPSDATVLATDVRGMSRSEFRTFEARGGPQQMIAASVRKMRRDAAAAAAPAPLAPPAPAPPTPSVAEREVQLTAEETTLTATYNATREKLLEIQRARAALKNA